MATSSVELDGYHVHLKTFPPNLRCRWPARVPGRLCVFLEGEMLEARGGGHVRYRVSDVVYKPPEDRPRLRFGRQGAATITIELLDQGLRTLSSGGISLEEPFHERSLFCHSVAERVRSEILRRDDMTPLVLEGLTLDLFAEAHRARSRSAVSAKPPRWLANVRERLEEEFRAPRTLADYARDAGVHPTLLARRFREHYRCSVGELVRHLRLGRAMRELEESDKAIAEVALDAGFSDQSHLSRAFRSRLATTPAAFRRARRS